MNNLNFPSGPWIGFYVYNHAQQARHRMDLGLTFANGRITGGGSDDLGKFVISGRFNSKDGTCHWAKMYVGMHDVYYKGYREKRGIWGTWEITFATGGFHIWPLSHGQDLGKGEREKKTQSSTIIQPVLAPARIGRTQTVVPIPL
jgi:hypothetical protein